MDIWRLIVLIHWTFSRHYHNHFWEPCIVYIYIPSFRVFGYRIYHYDQLHRNNISPPFHQIETSSTSKSWPLAIVTSGVAS